MFDMGENFDLSSSPNFVLISLENQIYCFDGHDCLDEDLVFEHRQSEVPMIASLNLISNSCWLLWQEKVGIWYNSAKL